jgi:hypothetical protein
MTQDSFYGYFSAPDRYEASILLLPDRSLRSLHMNHNELQYKCHGVVPEVREQVCVRLYLSWKVETAGVKDLDLNVREQIYRESVYRSVADYVHVNCEER